MAFITTPIRVLPSSHKHFSQTPLRLPPQTLRARHSFHPILPTTTKPVRMEFELSEGEPYPLNLGIVVLALIGWVVPSSLPAGIPLTQGTGLTQAFMARVSANLANWPKGPAADDPFWTLMVLWHIGLFACLIFGTIGWNGRKSGAFD